MSHLTLENFYRELESHISNETGVYDLTRGNHISIIDTPHMWGAPFSDKARIEEHGSKAKELINTAFKTIIQGATHTLDIISLAPPTGEFQKTLHEELIKKISDNSLQQVRILFGYLPGGEDTVLGFRKELASYIKSNLKGKSLLSPVTQIYVGRVHGGSSGGGAGPLSPWNHAKIVAADGKYALVGGHNLWPHNYADYPPVHDISLFICGTAAHSAQKFADILWTSSQTNLTKRNTWTRFYKYDYASWNFPGHDDGIKGYGRKLDRWEKTPPNLSMYVDGDIVIPDFLQGKDSTNNNSVLGVSRFTITDSTLNTHMGIRTPSYPSPSEKAKQWVATSATNRLYICQQDLLFKGAENIKNHNTIRWIADALSNNQELVVKIVVSSINAKSKDGSAYSWGSGAFGTYKEIYQILRERHYNDRAKWSSVVHRLHVAPFCFTDVNVSRFGAGHVWSESDKYRGKSAQFSTKVPLPKFYSSKYPEPANHSKFYMGVSNDGTGMYYVGSDNMYPHDLFEYGYMVSDMDAVKLMYKSYWTKVWQYSGPNCVCRICRSGYRAILNDSATDYRATLEGKFRRSSRESQTALDLIANFLSKDPVPSEEACHYLYLLLTGQKSKWPSGQLPPEECRSREVQEWNYSKVGSTFLELLIKNCDYKTQLTA